MEESRQRELLAVYRDGLLNNTLPFWWPRCVDDEHGGFLLARDRDGEGLDETLRQGNGPGPMVAMAADVAGDTTPDDAMALCRAELGAPSILVNNAGIGDARPAHLTDDANLDGFLDINLRALFRF